MGTEGLTDEQYIQQLRETVEQQRQRIAELEARVTQAERQASAHRTQARAEGFRAARERAAGRYDKRAAEHRRAAGETSNEKLRLEHRELAEQWESEARDIRAMEDAGEGGAGTGLHCGECSHMRHSGPCPENCACDMAETSGEPPLSQLRAATERMEAAAKPTPAAMLGEAVELFRRAENLMGAAGLYGLAGQASAFRTVAERHAREAEAREGRLVCDRPENARHAVVLKGPEER
jgi:hypothetical protein